MDFSSYCKQFGIGVSKERRVSLALEIAKNPESKINEYMRTRYANRDKMSRLEKRMFSYDARGGRLWDIQQDASDLRCYETMVELAQQLSEGSKNVLEVGCGSGLLICWLAAKSPEKFFYGIDFSQTMLWEAQRKAKLLGLRNVEFFLSDQKKMQFPDSFFDSVYHCNQHNYTKTYMKEKCRVAKSGGAILEMKQIKIGKDYKRKDIFEDYMPLIRVEPGTYSWKGIKYFKTTSDEHYVLTVLRIKS